MVYFFFKKTKVKKFITVLQEKIINYCYSTTYMIIVFIARNIQRVQRKTSVNAVVHNFVQGVDGS